MQMLRRRTMMASGGGGIERPDYFRFDFITNQDNQEIQIGYSLFRSLGDLILDEVSITLADYVIVPNAGSHIMYFRLASVLPSNYGIMCKFDANYVRIPYNTSEMVESLRMDVNSWSMRWKIIDILDARFIAAVKNNSYGTYSRADVVNVPIGTKQVYINEGTKTDVTNKMNEVVFKY